MYSALLSENSTDPAGTAELTVAAEATPLNAKAAAIATIKFDNFISFTSLVDCLASKCSQRLLPKQIVGHCYKLLFLIAIIDGWQVFLIAV